MNTIPLPRGGPEAPLLGRGQMTDACSTLPFSHICYQLQHLLAQAHGVDSYVQKYCAKEDSMTYCVQKTFRMWRNLGFHLHKNAMLFLFCAAYACFPRMVFRGTLHAYLCVMYNLCTMRMIVLRKVRTYVFHCGILTLCVCIKMFPKCWHILHYA